MEIHRLNSIHNTLYLLWIFDLSHFYYFGFLFYVFLILFFFSFITYVFQIWIFINVQFQLRMLGLMQFFFFRIYIVSMCVGFFWAEREKSIHNTPNVLQVRLQCSWNTLTNLFEKKKENAIERETNRKYVSFKCMNNGINCITTPNNC